MTAGRSAHRLATLALSLAMALLGVALIVEGLTASHVQAVRVLLGVLFLAAGCGRLYLQVRRGRLT